MIPCSKDEFVQPLLADREEPLYSQGQHSEEGASQAAVGQRQQDWHQQGKHLGIRL